MKMMLSYTFQMSMDACVSAPIRPQSVGDGVEVVVERHLALVYFWAKRFARQSLYRLYAPRLNKTLRKIVSKTLE